MVKENSKGECRFEGLFFSFAIASRRYYYSTKFGEQSHMAIAKGKFSSHSLSPRDPLLALISAPTIGISNRRDAPMMQVTANRGRPD